MWIVLVRKDVAIGPYHAAAILDLKRDWTGINNVLKLRKMACALFMREQSGFKSKMTVS